MSPRGNIKLNKSADVENQHTFKTKLALSPTAMCMCHSATERGRQQVPLFAYAPFYNKVIPLTTEQLKLTTVTYEHLSAALLYVDMKSLQKILNFFTDLMLFPGCVQVKHIKLHCTVRCVRTYTSPVQGCKCPALFKQCMLLIPLNAVHRKVLHSRK